MTTVGGKTFMMQEKEFHFKMHSLKNRILNLLFFIRPSGQIIIMLTYHVQTVKYIRFAITVS